MTQNNGLIVIAVVLGAASTLGLYLTYRVRPFQDRATVGVDSVWDARRVTRAAVLRIGVVVGTSAFLFVALIWLALALPALLAVPALIAPGMSVAFGLVLSAVLPVPRHPEPSSRSASLEPRRFWTFGSPGMLALLLFVAAALVALVIADASSAGSIAGGARFSRSYWTIATALVAMAVVLVAATLFALARLAAAPFFPTPDLLKVDRRLRLLTARTITSITFAVLLAYLGTVAATMGSRVSNLAQVSISDGRPDRLAAIFGPVLEGVAIAAIAASIASLIAAIVLTLAMGRGRATSAGTDESGADAVATVAS
ncbi:hypothetical protein F1C58_00530 [Glaciihabitans sp. INWT7]|uniref:hypothetical protein n=1 Tax=Glaciihabitans sp. INWT7 TaxID=2596912 RepID=UPI001623A054|nr:hypothetical protein [Glaciihabitans sp. INWT7]QNE45563.1 hypothetical protein F1C58_00530 [Glaciihabitans sp. INWT7]